MTHPLVVLRELLQKQAKPTVGTVQSIANTTAMVRTSAGISQYALGGFLVAPGQLVEVSGGAIVGLSRRSGPLPTYDV